MQGRFNLNKQTQMNTTEPCETNKVNVSNKLTLSSLNICRAGWGDNECWNGIIHLEGSDSLKELTIKIDKELTGKLIEFLAPLLQEQAAKAAESLYKDTLALSERVIRVIEDSSK